MRIMIAALGAVLLLGARAASAQPAPAGHEQHHTAGAKPESAKDKCCCEKDMAEMKSMMAEMMKMHQGMMQPGMMQPGMKMPMDGKTPSADKHKH
jgi:hypothetical protein